MRQAGAAVVTIVALAGAGVVLFIVQWMLGWGGHTAVARSPEYLTPWAAAVSVGVVIYWHVSARTRVHVRAPSRAALVVSDARPTEEWSGGRARLAEQRRLSHPHLVHLRSTVTGDDAHDRRQGRRSHVITVEHAGREPSSTR